MKVPTPIQRAAEVARENVIAWSKFDTPETMAAAIGCSVRSIPNWIDGKPISRLSARVINEAFAKWEKARRKNP